MRCSSTSRPPDEEHDDDGEAEQRLQRGPQHAHQANQLQAARDVFLVVGLEALDFGFFLHVGANQAGAGEVLLRAGGDVGEHCLNALEAIVNAAAEILHDDAEDGQRREGEKRKPRD